MNDFSNDLASGLVLDRSDWEIVKFGDVAFQQKKSVDRDNTNLTKYVKGEHMNSEDLHLREWGELTDEYLGPAFIRKFEEGDILYGSRRTYLRKVAIAHFDGITSNTTFVIKANEAKIDKRILPFVMLSEGFTMHSIRHSKGSVNPYINWKDIADYEFLLPPKEQQANFSELLWALDEVIQKNKTILNNFDFYSTVLSNCLLGLNDKSYYKKEWETKSLLDIAPLQRGFDLPNESLVQGAYPVCYSNGIGNYHENYMVKGPGVCTGRSGTIGNVFYIESDYWPHNTTLWVTDFKNNFPRYIYHLYSKLNFEKKMTGTGVPTLNRNEIHKIKVSVPKYKDQINISKQLDDLGMKRAIIVDYIDCSTRLKKSLINKIF